MFPVLEVTLPVFALVFCGYLASARSLLPDRAVEGINAFVFWFALPAMLFRVVGLRPITELLDVDFAIGFLATGFLIFALTYWLARTGWLAGMPRTASEAPALALNAAHGNGGYLGLALFAEIGAQTLPTVALVLICDIFIMITFTLLLLESARDQGTVSRSRLAVAGSVLRSPMVASIGAGLAFSLSGLTLPAVAENFTRLLAAAAGPCALFAIGAALGGRTLKINREIGALVVIKLLLHPLIAAVALYVLWPVDPVAAAVGVVCATLPSASNSFIIAQRYGVAVPSISASIVAGTALSVITVSLAIALTGLR
jgi:malonate transporter